MRAAILALILAVPRAPLTAQQAKAIQAPPAAPAPESAAEQTKPATAPSSTVVETTDSARRALSETTVDSLRALVAQVRRDPDAVPLPSNDSVAMGGRTIAANSRVTDGRSSTSYPSHRARHDRHVRAAPIRCRRYCSSSCYRSCRRRRAAVCHRAVSRSGCRAGSAYRRRH